MRRRHARLPTANGVQETDPYWANVVLLIDASNRANGATPSDIDAKGGKTPTWRGGCACSTAQAKFGSSSLYFDGTDDRLVFADSADWAPGTGDYTVEAWVRADPAGNAIDRMILGQSSTFNGFYPFNLRRTGSTNLAHGTVTDGSSIYGGNNGLSLGGNVWAHIAMSRQGANLYLATDGTVVSISSALSGKTLLDSTGALAIGAYSDFDTNGFDWYGYIDQVRITKGVARYTANYTVPYGPFPKQ